MHHIFILVLVLGCFVPVYLDKLTVLFNIFHYNVTNCHVNLDVVSSTVNLSMPNECK